MSESNFENYEERILITIEIIKTSTGSSQSPVKEDNDQTTINKSTYLQLNKVNKMT